MASKNRCNCFDGEINAVLAGLRREGPSTERSILERLVNLLSRAAVKDKGEVNPQKVWTKELQPSWWKEVTDLRWKNPREHPKDKKDDLKKKVNILHNKLSELNCMTTVLEEEFQLARNSNKADIELKSDFEAIIAKVSGLHFMLENVSKKLKAAKDFSEKIAHYVRQISSCFGKCHLVVEETTLIVEARDKKKDQLWQSMGLERPASQQTNYKKKLPDPILSVESILGPDDFVCLFDSSPELSPGVDAEAILFNFPVDDTSEDNTLPKTSQPDSATDPAKMIADSSHPSLVNLTARPLIKSEMTNDSSRTKKDNYFLTNLVSSASEPTRPDKPQAPSPARFEFISIDSLANKATQDVHSKLNTISVQRTKDVKNRMDEKTGEGTRLSRTTPTSTVTSAEVFSPDDSVANGAKALAPQKTRDSSFVDRSKSNRERPVFKPYPPPETGTRKEKLKSPPPVESAHERQRRSSSESSGLPVRDSNADRAQTEHVTRNLEKSRTENHGKSSKENLGKSHKAHGHLPRLAQLQKTHSSRIIQKAESFVGGAGGDVVWVSDCSSLEDVVEILEERPAPTVDMYVTPMDVDSGLGRVSSDHETPSCEDILPSVEGVIMEGLPTDATPNAPSVSEEDNTDKGPTTVEKETSGSAGSKVSGCRDSEASRNVDKNVSDIASQEPFESVEHPIAQAELQQKVRVDSLSAAIGSQLFV